MITEIGIVAGEIWHTLDDTGPCNLAHLCRVLERPHELILMSLGWLCREGHVQLVQQGEEYHVSVRFGNATRSVYEVRDAIET